MGTFCQQSQLASRLPRHAVSSRYLALVFLAALSVELSAQKPEADVEGSRDHPMITRVQGSTIKGFDLKEFDEYRIVTGPVPGVNEKGAWPDMEDALNDGNSIPLEGRVWKLTYEVPKTRSTLEIVRSFEAELTKAGFKTLYQCASRACAGKDRSDGSSNFYEGLVSLMMKRAGFYYYGGFIHEGTRYLAARLPRAEGDVYVSVMAIEMDTPLARVDVIEVKPMKGGLVAVNAATMAKEIATKGKVALYGIYFDTNKAEIKPESRATLEEIATMLKQQGKMNLIVVGHTDTNGTLDYNLDLSLRRAQAVVAALTSDFGISASRLEARGVGFLAPVAPNDTEEQRAQNRRVELLNRAAADVGKK